MRWIPRLTTTNVEATSWAAHQQVHIPKASLTFPTKVWFAVAPAQLRPIRNDNSLSPSQANIFHYGWLCIICWADYYYRDERSCPE